MEKAKKEIEEQENNLNKGEGLAYINFEQESDFYGNYLQGMYAAGFSYIPLIGSLIGDISQFMNSPSLIQGGAITFRLDYFANIVQYFCYMYSAYLYVFGSNKFIIAVAFMCAIALFDCFDEAKDVIPASRRFKPFCKKEKQDNRRNNQE